MNLATLQRKLAQRDKQVPARTIEECYNAGKDAAINGAQTSNCHFSFFESPEKTAAWERGNDDGLKKEAREK